MPRSLVILIAALSALLAHGVFESALRSTVAVPLVIATCIAWLMPYRLVLLLVYGMVLELFSVLPPGVLFIACLLPVAAHRFRGRIVIDISLTFFALLAAVTGLQLAIVYAFSVTHITSLPLFLVLLTWFCMSSLSWVACIMIDNTIPVTNHA